MSRNNIVQLNCLVWEKRHTPQVHPIQVGRDQTVSCLIEEICKQQEAFGVSLRRNIELFKCSTISVSPKKSLKARIQAWNPDEDEDSLQPADEISEWFPDIPSKSLVHIVIVATDVLTLNYAFVGHEVVDTHSIKISRSETVETVKKLINKEWSLSTRSAALQIWKPSDPMSLDDMQAVQNQLRRWPKTDAPQPLQNHQILGEQFPFNLPDDILHLIVKMPSPPEHSKHKTISLTDRELAILTIYMKHPKFPKQDIECTENHVILQIVENLDLEHIPPGLPLQTIELLKIFVQLRKAPLLAKEEILLDSLTEELFLRIYGVTDGETRQTTNETYKDHAEVFSFVHLAQVFRHIAETSASKNSSSSLKETVFCSAFTVPTLLLALLSENVTYKQDQAWPFPISVCGLHLAPENRRRRNSPRSDFCLVFDDLIMFVVGEVVSDPQSNSDRYRMLLQAIVAARVAKYLLRDPSDTFVVMAIYVTQNLTAERYLVTQVGSDPDMDVHITQQNFNLLNTNEAADFLLSLYNYQEYISKKKDKFDTSRAETFRDTAQVYMKGFRSLTGHLPTNHGDKKSKENQSLESFQEENGSSFNSHQVRLLLNQMQCEFEEFDAPNVACLLHRPTQSRVMLKHIRPHSAEADILHYLSNLESDENHTIQPVSFWRVDMETFVSMPVAGYELDATSSLVRYSLLSVVRQLVDGVAFMHKHGVAHLDLKPANVFVNSLGYLSIIDFSVSRQVSRGVDSMMEGLIGTTGYMAPEVGQGPFSPILADVWACGNLLEIMCGRQRSFEAEPWLRETVLQLSAELMDYNPRQRPCLSDVAIQLQKVAVSRGSSLPLPARYIPPWSITIPREVTAS